uniref:Uncharacterized protein n=1 Tax=Mycena chlorophos TaxID=658473 RepID=A0ABQ0KUJ6_MYCCL|nr:predicted protein [Mycena chlorophos]
MKPKHDALYAASAADSPTPGARLASPMDASPAAVGPLRYSSEKPVVDSETRVALRARRSDITELEQKLEDLRRRNRQLREEHRDTVDRLTATSADLAGVEADLAVVRERRRVLVLRSTVAKAGLTLETTGLRSVLKKRQTSVSTVVRLYQSASNRVSVLEGQLEIADRTLGRRDASLAHMRNTLAATATQYDVVSGPLGSLLSSIRSSQRALDEDVDMSPVSIDLTGSDDSETDNESSSTSSTMDED